MIPKIIHYCWFGNNPLPELSKKCIKSWYKCCPGYTFFKWDETNFNIEKAPIYVREAYEGKKWAFVADYVRLWAIFNYGGIYLDTDIEVIKKNGFNDLLKYDSFFGFETTNYIATGLGFGAIKGHPIVSLLMGDYMKIHFKKKNGFDMTTCPVRNRHVFLDYGFFMNNQLQVINNNVVLTNDYLCAKDYKTLKISKTKNTISIHHFSASWWSEDEKKEHSKRIKAERIDRRKEIIRRLLGNKIYNFLKCIKKR